MHHSIYNKRFGPTVSSLILLGLVLITTGVWYAAYKAEVIADALVGQSANVDDFDQ